MPLHEILRSLGANPNQGDGPAQVKNRESGEDLGGGGTGGGGGGDGADADSEPQVNYDCTLPSLVP